MSINNKPNWIISRTSLAIQREETLEAPVNIEWELRLSECRVKAGNMVMCLMGGRSVYCLILWKIIKKILRLLKRRFVANTQMMINQVLPCF